MVGQRQSKLCFNCRPTMREVIPREQVPLPSGPGSEALRCCLLELCDEPRYFKTAADEGLLRV